RPRLALVWHDRRDHLLHPPGEQVLRRAARGDGLWRGDEMRRQPGRILLPRRLQDLRHLGRLSVRPCGRAVPGMSRQDGTEAPMKIRTVSLVSRLPGLLLCISMCPGGPLAPRDAAAQELLQNGGFENGADPWTGCGGITLVDSQDAGTTAAMVRTGRFAARIGGLSDG